MKTQVHYLFLAIVIMASCSKNKNDDSSVPVAATVEKFASLQDFYNRNGLSVQLYTIDGTTGGSFTTTQGTMVTVPANAFVTLSNAAVTGNVIIEFKDVYKRSDMLFNQLSTIAINGKPLKSGGMFFIKASQNNIALKLAPAKNITVAQPFAAAAALADSAMLPFVRNDSLIMPGNNQSWAFSYSDSLRLSVSEYIFSLYKFSFPEDSGTWCNSDNSFYFSAYPQTTLSLKPTDNVDTFKTDVFLVFKTVNSMIHIYKSSLPPISFPYSYAPVGLQCTVVALGVRDSLLYSSFTPITISTNQSLYFTLSKTTSKDFKAELNALN